MSGKMQIYYTKLSTLRIDQYIDIIWTSWFKYKKVHEGK